VKETPLALSTLGTVSAVLLAAGLAACDQAPSADALPEWKPSDHHSVDDNAGGGASGQQAPAGARGGGAGETAQLVEMAWKQQCIQCHGPMGHGDGPNGPLFHPRDLADPQWQATVSDADLAASIKNGKNKMPKFDLPEPVLQGMVARIRMLKAGNGG
jgi:cytochrome c oxidase cbb3-type subunit 3